MSQSRIFKVLLLLLPLVAIALFWAHATRSARHADTLTQSETPAKSAAPSQQLSPQGQAALQAIIQSGKLPDLRWPDFSDYAKHLQKFYDLLRVFPDVGQRHGANRASATVHCYFVASRPRGTVRPGLRRAALGRSAR